MTKMKLSTSKGKQPNYIRDLGALKTENRLVSRLKQVSNKSLFFKGVKGQILQFLTEVNVSTGKVLKTVHLTA